MERFLWVCAGGALGTGLRYLLSGWMTEKLGPSFPFGTLAVNVLGSALLGAILYAGVTTDLLSPLARVTLATGVLGGFTTYSTFNYETLGYVEQRQYGLALANVAATLFGCLAAGIAGQAAARALLGK